MSKLITREDRDIAIVGISVFCPAGESVEEFWDGISRGVDFITDAPPEIIAAHHFEGQPNGIDRFYCKRGGFSKAFKVDPLRYGILPITADAIDPDELLSLAGSEQALIDADIFEKGIPLQNGAIIIGKGNFSGAVSLRSLEIVRTAWQLTALIKSILPDLSDEDIERIRKGYQAQQGRYQADMAIGTMPNLVASMVANRFDMHGPAYTVDAACASGIVAINHSIGLLRSGQIDVAVAGGMHTAQSAMFWGAFDMMGAMSRRGEIAPFSKNADGLLIGQGGGFIVLKTLRKALEDGDRIYALIKDTAIASDGAGTHVTVTSVKGQVRVLKRAWEAAGMDPELLGYVEAHGTATPVGDRTELNTLKEFFGDNTHPQAFVGSVKSNMGHTMPAAGMMGIIKTALSLYHRQIPPTLHCEDPLPAMFESRFLPPQELIDWDTDQYPLIAGVNAFGFGGINSHAILTAYEPTKGMPPQPKPKVWLGEALRLSATSKDALIEKLKSGDYTDTGGNYRLVIFEPSDERVQKAISIVEKDKPWRGRMDIWFSNQALIENGGKVVFLCPGFGPDEIPETESISRMLDLPFVEEELAKQDILEHTRTTLRNFIVGFLCKEALEKLGIEPDIYVGHSVGEWNATIYAGMTDGNWKKIGRMVNSLYNPLRFPLIAVSGIDIETVNAWCDEIDGLYLSNDNCPSQVLLAGTESAVEILTKRLADERLFYSILPYGAGFHTPLIGEDNQDQQILETVDVHEGHTPVWSATTLELVPSDRDEYNALVDSQMRRPVYFRELTEKLYAEQNACVFVQLGVATLNNFVEDTLKGQDICTVSAVASGRLGADQLRRVLAALYIEGRPVDADFLGVKPLYRTEHSLLTVLRGAPPILDELPELTEVVKQRYGDVGSHLAQGLEGAESLSGNPVLDAASANLREASKVQSELVRLFEQMPQSAFTSSTTPAESAAALGAGSSASPFTFSRSAPAAPSLPPTNGSAGARIPTQASREDFKETLRLNFEDHPYLVDHSIVRQPEGWEFADDLNLVVPLTMTIELLSEIAQRYVPDHKLVCVSKVWAYRWITLEAPFEETLEGHWKGPLVLELNLVGFAKAEFTFADEYPEPPAEYLGDIDVGEKIMENVTPDVLYHRYSFHGPQYHSNIGLVKVGARGMINYAQRRGGKGSLLDVMGQQLGLFLHLTQTVNTISFPIRLKELSFYADIFDQEGVFEHTMVITRLTESSIVGDMILKRDGKIWAVARDFVCQRFENYLPVWGVIREPQCNKLAEEIAPGVYHYTNVSRNNVLDLLSKRYLNGPDRAEIENLGSSTRIRELLTSRIVLKDAVRDFVQQHHGGGEMIFPIEIFYAHDEKGKPLVNGYGRTVELIEDLEISLSHKGDEAVAIVAKEPVGIDLEKIEEKSEGFLKASFTERERALLAPLEQPEAILRFWVAKEAVAKKAGTGLEGNPKRFEVTAVDGDVLTVGDQKVQIVKIGEEHVVGWTI
ncbi:MAG: 4'-phosphopantetheinyl transferase superfamily protein [Coriobacteriales bacterium]|nr:4'-phosphopantetheinyl transferase superfamily protein [Coriobacteriales bacterium]